MSFEALFDAVYLRLLNDTALKELVYKPKTSTTKAFNGVYDSVPENAPFPYVVIGEPTETDFDVKLQETVETTLTIHTWSKTPGKLESYKLLEAVSNALRAFLIVEGYTLEDVKKQRTAVFDDIDGVLRHGVLTLEYTLTKL